MSRFELDSLCLRGRTSPSKFLPHIESVSSSAHIIGTIHPLIKVHEASVRYLGVLQIIRQLYASPTQAASRASNPYPSTALVVRTYLDSVISLANTYKTGLREWVRSLYHRTTSAPSLIWLSHKLGVVNRTWTCLAASFYNRVITLCRCMPLGWSVPTHIQARACQPNLPHKLAHCTGIEPA